MKYRELSNEQRRQLIDAQQAFRVWREADQEFRHGYPPLYKGYRATMRWKPVNGREYLYRGDKSLGLRSPETERIKAEYADQRTKLRARLTRLENRLEEMRPVNRAMGLGRVPEIAARVLRRLDHEDLLGKHLFVAGTHAMFAYEARTGVLFEGDLTATTDIDFLWDARRRFTFLMKDVQERGVLGLLQQVDATFRKHNSYNAANDDPYLVDFIRPEQRREGFKAPPAFTKRAGDLEPAAIKGLQWLVNAPKFEDIAIGEDGSPLFLSCVDPLVFSLHKVWVSKQFGRGPQARRDMAQAVAVASMAQTYLKASFDRKTLKGLPNELLAGADELTKAIRAQDAA
jgi:hypothetical protein